MSATPLALPGPLFLFLLTVAVALLSYLVHRWTTLSGGIAAAGCLILGWVCVRQLSGEPSSVPLLQSGLVLGRSFTFLGHDWTLTSSALAVLAFTYLVAGLAFLLGLPASQGWSFYPFSVAVVAVLSLAVTTEQYIYAVLFLWMAAALAPFILAGGRPEKTTGALRTLAFTSIAVMPLLLLPAFLGPETAVTTSPAAFAFPTGPTVPTEWSPYVAPILMIVGFGILMVMVPFHGQLVALAADGAPMVAPFALSAFLPVVLYTFFRLGETYPLLLEDELVFTVCRWAGIAIAAIGGLSALGQRQWAPLVGYAALVDWGAGLVALGQGTAPGAQQATEMLVWRASSLLLVGAGWTIVFRMTGQQDSLDRCHGLLQRRPLSILALFLGMLSLAAFPLTPGALGRWPLILDLLASERTMAYVLILAGVGVGIGAIIGLRACVHPRAASPDPTVDATTSRAQQIVDAAFALLALWLVGAFLLQPAPWAELARQFLSDFTFAS
jgi:formate hydrogenlyase subunit 3/multisubunit Na+/H+ antiporter MnhD subunit